MYYPILKGCLGEWIALENFSLSSRSSVFPTIEIPPVELKYEEELGVSTGPKKTVAEHVRHISKAMDKHLPQSWQFGLDGSRCFKDNQLHCKMYQGGYAGPILPLPKEKKSKNPKEKLLSAAVTLLANWCHAIETRGAGWDDWDTWYKDANYAPGPLRRLIDEKKAEIVRQDSKS